MGSSLFVQMEITSAKFVYCTRKLLTPQSFISLAPNWIIQHQCVILVKIFSFSLLHVVLFFRGFENVGNTCYRNSVLQSLLSLPPFIRFVHALFFTSLSLCFCLSNHIFILSSIDRESFCSFFHSFLYLSFFPFFSHSYLLTNPHIFFVLFHHWKKNPLI